MAVVIDDARTTVRTVMIGCDPGVNEVVHNAMDAVVRAVDQATSGLEARLEAAKRVEGAAVKRASALESSLEKKSEDIRTLEDHAESLVIQIQAHSAAQEAVSKGEEERLRDQIKFEM